MTPEQASVRAAQLLIGRLVKRHGLTVEEAVAAVAQRRRREAGPHTDLVVAEATAVLAEVLAPVRAVMEALRPMAQAAAAAMADLARALRQAATATRGTRADRPAWASPYGPPPRRR
ncbi:hypothetical protein [Streptomyces sp. DH12]|uniref:hypothetical protein n=1 Tax=Streptomyces sp. DH12 TaxID=2857010 RepID=UPI001E4C94D0|nr:hypothetical protein [Streptomyces sp. DH12]